MRTHKNIIREATVSKVRTVLASAGLPVSEATVRSWMRRPDDRGSIPGAYWRALAAARIATLSELSAHAETVARTKPDEAA